MPTHDEVLDTLRSSMLEALRWLEDEILPELPEPMREKARAELNVLRELLEDRPPRFAIVGRRGSGKSTLLNAIFGSEVAEVGSTKSTTVESTWYEYTNTNGAIWILDTRGLGDGLSHRDGGRRSAEEELKHAIEQRHPDAFLFLCKAKEVDARLEEDLDSLCRIRAYVGASPSHLLVPILWSDPAQQRCAAVASRPPGHCG